MNVNTPWIHRATAPGRAQTRGMPCASRFNALQVPVPMVVYLEIDRDKPRPDLIHRAAKALREGKLVACPTDTTYGVFAAFDQREAVARLTRLRMDMGGDSEAAEAEQQKTLSIIFADLDMLSG